MMRRQYSIRNCMILILFVALGLAIHVTQSRIDKLDQIISSWRTTEQDAFSNRNWEPDPEFKSAHFGPRYGLRHGSIWQNQDAWFEREYWIAVPVDQPHVVELLFFDWSDGSMIERFTADAPSGRSLLRWDLQDCQVNKVMMVWIDDQPVIDVRVPINEPARVCWNYQYCHPEKEPVTNADGPIRNRLQVAANCILPPPNWSANNAWMARLFEIRIRPKDDLVEDVGTGIESGRLEDAGQMHRSM